ncbi:elongator complex protein [Acrasis kona]|uniref:Elongator complex protein n=1 Tax=Acrasis kona TaxID=1008807 RepID=A0AAW2Z1Y7_9EUKA
MRLKIMKDHCPCDEKDTSALVMKSSCTPQMPVGTRIHIVNTNQKGITHNQYQSDLLITSVIKDIPLSKISLLYHKGRDTIKFVHCVTSDIKP